MGGYRATGLKYESFPNGLLVLNGFRGQGFQDSSEKIQADKDKTWILEDAVFGYLNP
jgi:hypothetical protein